MPPVLDGTHALNFLRSNSWVQLDLWIRTGILHEYRIVFDDYSDIGQKILRQFYKLYVKVTKNSFLSKNKTLELRTRCAAP